ncbi:MAG: 50S ribosomal protein L19 [Saprospiraceae bacterium]|nr:50S ribosomal protein L19 [Saprospiraceae bacterium]
MNLIDYVHEQLTPKRELPSFRPGDNISVSYKIIEGAKERIQVFRGDVIQINGTGATKTFTVRKISNGVGVERIIPFSSPAIAEIEVLKRGKVRRAKLFYLRALTGKKQKSKKEDTLQSNISSIQKKKRDSAIVDSLFFFDFISQVFNKNGNTSTFVKWKLTFIVINIKR